MTYTLPPEPAVGSEFTINAIRSACLRAIDRASHHLAQPNVPQSIDRYQAETNLAHQVLDLLPRAADLGEPNG